VHFAKIYPKIIQKSKVKQKKKRRGTPTVTHAKELTHSKWDSILFQLIRP
jgi:hypothetical protein